MANKLTTRPTQRVSTDSVAKSDGTAAPGRPLPEEHGLVGDVVFEPPLTAEERRRRRVGIPLAERLEQARRQLAEGKEAP